MGLEEFQMRDIMNKVRTECIYLLKHSYKAGFTAEDLEPFNDMVKKALKLTNATPYEITQFKVEQAIKKFRVSSRDTGSAAIQGKSLF